jgi:hypothetical protein
VRLLIGTGYLITSRDICNTYIKSSNTSGTPLKNCQWKYQISEVNNNYKLSKVHLAMMPYPLISPTDHPNIVCQFSVEMKAETAEVLTLNNDRNSRYNSV